MYSCNIDDLLKKKSLTTTKLAEMVGVGYVQMYRIRKNKSQPSKSVKILLTIINNGYDIEELVKNPREK